MYVKYDDILERYWKSVSKFQGIKGQNYDNNKFSNNKAIIILSLKLLLEWVEFQDDCPKNCPCCGEDNQSFEHWFFKCDALASFRLEFFKFYR